MRTLFFAAVVAAGLISGCGAANNCSTSNCDGCCDQNSGMCLGGRDNASCGHDGAYCTPCPSAQMCVPSSTTGTVGGKCQQ
jgi:hypothetical protein